MKKLLFPMLLIAPAVAARAEDTNSAALRIMSACRNDLRTRCRPAPAGGPLKCLKDHRDQVAPDCRAALDASNSASVPASGKPPRAPKGKSSSCLPEFMKLCPKAADINACLKEHRGELSERCRAAADALDNSRKKPR